MEDDDRKALALNLLDIVAFTRSRQPALRVAEASACNSLRQLSPDLPADSQKVIPSVWGRPQQQPLFDRQRRIASQSGPDPIIAKRAFGRFLAAQNICKEF
ncbi:hypothetical protein EI545_05295 [Tabrizicola piscis]|uniref:Uncharacterized protein n=1 Tax=Tabrizicola piscis TaxID=2494374 RepID=A0A3S8U3Y1_9RHOB|nr:hypothetical protein [Tabrizicola piscis]AZL58304.1 hypothetical protein EI545_05295 [Tabrizicola piscis]